MFVLHHFPPLEYTDGANTLKRAALQIHAPRNSEARADALACCRPISLRKVQPHRVGRVGITSPSSFEHQEHYVNNPRVNIPHLFSTVDTQGVSEADVPRRGSHVYLLLSRVRH